MKSATFLIHWETRPCVFYECGDYCKGFWSMWNSCSGVVFGVVEDERGLAHLIPCEEIVFLDSKEKFGEVDWDLLIHRRKEETKETALDEDDVPLISMEGYK